MRLIGTAFVGLVGMVGTRGAVGRCSIRGLATTVARPLAGLLELLPQLQLPAPLRPHFPGLVLILPLLPRGGLGLGDLVEVVPGLMGEYDMKDVGEERRLVLL